MVFHVSCHCPQNNPVDAMSKRLLKRTAFVAAALSVAGVIASLSDLTPSTGAGLDPELAHLLLDSRSAVPMNPWEEALYRPRKLTPLPPDQIDTETLWLARAIYSETKRPEEQALVAWVIRNRVETGYRGKRTYADVVLDPYQFSAFLDDAPKRDHYANLVPGDREAGWKTALYIAYVVRQADGSHRPFSPETRHFYSERSLTNGMRPSWAADRRPVRIDVQTIKVDDRRFRFFEGVS